jgi:TQXA domain-containing protein
MTMAGVGHGQGVTGFFAVEGNPFDPVKDGYPAANPTTEFESENPWFAGIIYGAPTSGAVNLSLYCIDLHTETSGGVPYNLGSWSDADVPNVGYIARILDENYPNNPNQPAVSGEDAKAAAVQAAIWFFSDRYVLSTADPLHDAVKALVTAVITAGPIVEPPPPSLTLTPSPQSGQVGQTIGPFTLASTVDATVTANGATMWKDASATDQITDGATLASGAQIWLKSTAAAPTATLSAQATANVPSGNVYLYAGNSPNGAQKLILAKTATLKTTVTAEADFEGSLEVDKTIAGPAAGKQGPITISVSCDKGPKLDNFTIPAGTPAKTLKQSYDGIPVGATCTVTESQDGSTGKVAVTMTGTGAVSIPVTGTATSTVTNTYTLAPPGSLVVEKTITGTAAGAQGLVRISVKCDETPDSQTPDFVIPAGTTGAPSKTYTGIPAGAQCTVTEAANGSSKTVQVDVAGSPQTVTVPTGSSQSAKLTDTYTATPGSLTVQKSITGSAAGQQGEVRISVDCGEGSPTLDDFVIPAGTKPGTAGTISKTYSGIPAGAVCTATETEDGHTSTVVAVVKVGTDTATIPAAATGTVELSDAYTFVPGQLVVTKMIGGVAAGKQGDITIVPTCDGTKLDAFVIKAGALAGSSSKTYPALAANATCVATETVDGHTATVAVAVTGSGKEVTIPSAGTATATIADDYTDQPGTLVVNKTIAGDAALPVPARRPPRHRRR